MDQELDTIGGFQGDRILAASTADINHDDRNSLSQSRSRSRSATKNSSMKVKRSTVHRPRQPVGAYQAPYKESAKLAQKEVNMLKKRLQEKDEYIQQLERELLMRR